MRIFLLDAKTASAEQLNSLAKTLPPFRAALAGRCRRPEGFAQCVLGFCLARYAIKAVAPDADTENWAYNGCGKPHLSDHAPCFNLSHAGDVIAVAIADREVGLDVEQITPRAKGFVARYFSQDEQGTLLSAADPDSELARIWSAKEAHIKQEGRAIEREHLRNIPSNGVKNTLIPLHGERYWLSICPADEPLELTWVDAAKLY